MEGNQSGEILEFPGRCLLKVDTSGYIYKNWSEDGQLSLKN